MATLYAIVKVETPDGPVYSENAAGFRYPMTPDDLASAILYDGIEGDNHYKSVNRTIVVVTGNTHVMDSIDNAELQPLAVQTTEHEWKDRVE